MCSCVCLCVAECLYVGWRVLVNVCVWRVCVFVCCMLSSMCVHLFLCVIAFVSVFACSGVFCVFPLL